ncbi:tRNA-queuosine alpha-mannosyltransferase domain-containing protein [Marinomonas spartinae]|uniref:tRNA-queuosine alpha-mannosyltransferase domain-containing protein n=1 Tax=Marinomonas spartinae TaxID=1792290 RepID=UPI0018F1C53D|nr:DUF3524 domain-containing protein [Marinomonas spartinae]MBJ7555158.1 DUF3524 domain-containing protein [Marinomonas spartinae]
MRILLLSAYEASSHKAWANSLMNGLGEHDWTYLALPPRHFAWRIRGNAMSFAFDKVFKPSIEQAYDLVIATSMTDCVGLKAFCPNLQSIPWLLYFHENQFAYPASDKQQGLVEMQMVTLYSALAANQCVFNSHFNKHSFFEGARRLLKKLPDYVSPDWLSNIEGNAHVVPVPIDIDWKNRGERSRTNLFQNNSPLRLVWNARWEFDKGPERLLAILQALQSRGVDFEIAILGEQFRTIPKAFEVIQHRFASCIRQFGFAPSRDEYLGFLATSDIVLSTALHEFQGLAVLEAVALGCVPVLPARQVYPELFGPAYLYDSHLNDIAKEATAAVDRIVLLVNEETTAPQVNEYQRATVLKHYRALIENINTL